MKQQNKKSEYEMRVLAEGKKGIGKVKMRNMLGLNNKSKG